MRRILVFGDSNSWGYVPAKGTRFPEDVRWPGVAAKELGEDFCILEDCISGRTTVIEDPRHPKRCGLDALGYSLISQSPLDLLVLAVGTNDLKFTDAEGYRKGITTLIDFVMDAQRILILDHPIFRDDKKQILLVGPPLINPEICNMRQTHQLAHAAEESKKLAPIAKEVAAEKGIAYIDASAYVYPDTTDCLHISSESQMLLGKIMAEKIRSLF